MNGYLRARGLLWTVPAGAVGVVLAAWFAQWVQSLPFMDHDSRIPAVVLGGLVVAVCCAPGMQTSDVEVEGSCPRPRRWVEVGLTVGSLVLCAVLAVALIPGHSLQRGGGEMARDVLGLSGLALTGAALAGPRLGWVLPFGYASASYFSVTHDFHGQPWQAWPGWLIFPATWPSTWVVAVVLFLGGLAVWAWAGFIPRPRGHPLR